MNILFITLGRINSINERGIYSDLLRKFSNEGHNVTVISPVERRQKIDTHIKHIDGATFLKVKTLNITKTNILEKGISTLAIEYQFLNAIKKYLSDVKFDVVMYSTPPITFAKVIEYIKKRDGAYSYLLLKDIFPQNAVDMKMIMEGGVMHKMFKRKEKHLYKLSDTIGCMSPANVDFLLENNPYISPSKVEVNPNTIEPVEINYSKEDKAKVRAKYGVPVDKKVLVYGGNLGKPQGLDFLIETIETTDNKDAFFLIVGDGTEYGKLKSWFDNNKPTHAILLQRLPKDDYDTLLAACDIGLIFLDKNFLIPNFPSRLLPYLEMGVPVLTATDPNTDIGTIVENNGCGLKVLAGNQNEMQYKLNKLLSSDLKKMGENGKQLLLREYTVDRSYELIVEKVKG